MYNDFFFFFFSKDLEYVFLDEMINTGVKFGSAQFFLTLCAAETEHLKLI